MGFMDMITKPYPEVIDYFDKREKRTTRFPVVMDKNDAKKWLGRKEKIKLRNHPVTDVHFANAYVVGSPIEGYYGLTEIEGQTFVVELDNILTDSWRVIWPMEKWLDEFGSWPGKPVK